jgi:hypothetical protein
VRFAEKNLSTKRARRSTVTLYFSPSLTLGSGAIRLTSVHVKALKRHKKARRRVLVTVPARLPAGSYFLIGCINRSAATKRHRARRGCRRANRTITVVRTTGGGPGGGGGTGGGNSCVPTDNPTLKSSSPTCFDGNAARGIFVSPSGNDANPGTMAAPKRTLAAGIAAASLVDRDVYVAAGVYPELLTVANGVSVYGGYDSSWQRSPANTTEITGAEQAMGTLAAQATNITAPTTLQLLTLEPSDPTAPGEGSYGLEGTGDTGLVLDHVTVLAAQGTAGAAGADGIPGLPGGDGARGDCGGCGNGGGQGGSSPVGHAGGGRRLRWEHGKWRLLGRERRFRCSRAIDYPGCLRQHGWPRRRRRRRRQQRHRRRARD